MDERLTRVEAAVRELEQSVRAIDRRLAAIESSLAAAGPLGYRAALHVPALPPDDHTDHRHGAVTLPRSGPDIVTVLSFVGRTFVALGGAYLLRALTDSAVLPPRIGVASGLLYGMFWLVMADRAGSRGQSLNATFHALVTSMIGFPVLWEAVTRFKLFGSEASALVMVAVTAAALAVAIRWRLQTVAWIVVIPAVTTSLMTIAATGVVVPIAIFLIALGVATLWLGYKPLGWIFLRWPVALVADLCVLAFAMRASTRSWPDPPLVVIAVQLLLLTGYLASIVIRTLIRGREVIPFEIFQTLAALAVGFGGAVYVAAVTGAGERVLAVINLAAGAGCYGVAFAFIAKRQGLRQNFYFYTSLAIVLVLVSTNLLLQDAAAAATFAGLGILAAWLAWHVGHIALNLHAAGYIVAAASEAGLLNSAAYALLAPASEAWLPFPPMALLVLLAALVCWLIPMSPRAESWGAYSRLPRLLITLVLAWALGGWIVAVLTPLLSGTPGAGADPGVVATIRTTVLATSALGLAGFGCLDRFRESGWLMYPVLVAGGLKLLAEDFPLSKPATLFVALAIYGGALIVAPRLLRRQAPSDGLPKQV